MNSRSKLKRDKVKNFKTISRFNVNSFFFRENQQQLIECGRKKQNKEKNDFQFEMNLNWSIFLSSSNFSSKIIISFAGCLIPC